MDKPTKHIIKKQVLILHKVRKKDAVRMQRHFRQFFYDEMLPFIDEYCTKLTTNGDTYRIGHLEIDLGKLDPAQFVNLPKERIRALLEEAFLPHLKTQKERSNKQLKKQDIHEELFQYFVQTGSLPWWSNTTSPNPIIESLTAWLQDRPNTLQSSMAIWATQEQLLKRIIRAIPFTLLLQVAALKVSDSGSRLEKTGVALLEVLAQIPALTNKSRQRLQEILGIKLLQLIFVQGINQAQGLAFWEALIIQISVLQGLSYPVFLQALVLQQQKVSKASVQSELHEILLALKDDRLKRKPGVNAPKDIATSLSFLTQIVDEVEAQSKVLLATTTEEIVKKLWKLLKDSSLPTNYQSKIASILKQLQTKPNQFDVVKELVQLLQLLESDSRQPQQLPEPQARVKKEAFNQADELFLANAGLVMLWPYLQRFFDSLGLLENKTFKHSAAAHRAVGLLQFIADGQEQPTEYACGLNKVLCGLAWDEVLDFGDPITEGEAKECTLLLQAIIANAPILKGMSIDGMRGTFLLRQGMLRSAPGSWQLHVERESYDVVLDQFPWSWSFVKLPWMELSMEVVW